MRILFIILNLILLALSALAQTEVITKNQRALIALINMTNGKDPKKLKTMIYADEQNNARDLIRSKTEDTYAQTIIHFKDDATEANLLSSAQTLALNPNIKAIDVIFYTHGHNGEDVEGQPSLGLMTSDHLFVPSSVLAPKLKAVGRGKLRMLYSDACWSSTQSQDWLNGGFVAVAGSKEVDANHAIDLRRFFRKWNKGNSFGSSIDYANKNLFSKVMDFVIGGDSTKIAVGVLDLNINTGYQKINLNSIGQSEMLVFTEKDSDATSDENPAEDEGLD